MASATATAFTLNRFGSESSILPWLEREVYSSSTTNSPQMSPRQAPVSLIDTACRLSDEIKTSSPLKDVQNNFRGLLLEEPEQSAFSGTGTLLKMQFSSATHEHQLPMSYSSKLTARP